MQFSIYRYNPERDKKPRMQDYTLDVAHYKPAMVLDALGYLKEQDETLSFRRSCGEGVCGSDGMSINGRNSLACITPLASLKEPIVLRPLPGMPVIRDLIVDLTQFFEQYNKTKPYLQNTEVAPEKERLQSPADRAKLDGLYECILCACCSSSCPSYWWNPDKFLGPAASMQAARFIVDSRDNATTERLEQLEDAYSVFRCRSIMSCVQSCPKDLNPNQAIAEIRDQLIKK
jgi:succinate dehydrogenase / fumarate reductase, iron-sulfur subunit